MRPTIARSNKTPHNLILAQRKVKQITKILFLVVWSLKLVYKTGKKEQARHAKCKMRILERGAAIVSVKMTQV